MRYLKVWTSFRELLEPLPAAARGELFTAMLLYAETGEEPELTGEERYVWPSARQAIRAAREEYERQKAYGQKGGRPRKAGPEAEEDRDQEPADQTKTDREPAEKTEKAKKGRRPNAGRPTLFRDDTIIRQNARKVKRKSR